MKNKEQEIPEIADSDLDSDTKESVKKLVSRETSVVASLVVFSLILLALILPIFLDNSSLKFRLEQKISQSFQTKFTIYGEVKVRLLPKLAVVAEDVVLEDYKEKDSQKTYDIHAEVLTLQFPFFGGSSIKKIILSNAILTRYEADKELIQNNEISKKIADLKKNYSKNNPDSSEISAKLFNVADSQIKGQEALPEVIIKNSRAILYDKFARKNEINSIDLEAEISKDKIVASGDFVSRDVNNNFNLAAIFNSKSSSKDSYFDLVSPVFELHLKGNYTSQNRGLLKSDFLGDVEMEIMDLKSSYQSYVSADGVIATRLKNNSKPIKITANFDSHDNEILVNNLKIESDLLRGNGSIDVGLSEENPAIDVFLDLENLDLNNLWSNEVVKVDNLSNVALTDLTTKKLAEDVDDLQEKEEATIDKNDDPKINIELTKKLKNFDLTAEINIKKIKLLSGDINDSSIYLSASKQGDIIVMPAKFNLPGEAFLRVSGVFDNSTAISKFIGEFDGKGKSLREVLRWLNIESENLKLDQLKDFSIYSDVLLLPNSVALDNAILSFGDSKFSGDLKFQNNGKALDLTGRIHVDKFNIDDHFLTSGQNTYLSPGVLLKKVFWLNDIPSNNSLELSFDSLIYKDEKFDDQSFKVKIGRGYIEFSDLNLHSPKTDLRADFLVDISDKNPRFKLKVDAKKFHYESPNRDEKDLPKLNIFDQFFALPSLENFNGEVDLNIEEAKIDGLLVNGTKIAGLINDGNISKTTFDSEFYGGKFSYRGVLGLKTNKMIGGNMTFDNLDIEQFLSGLVGIKNISGIGNFAANVTSISGNKDEFISKLKSEIKFNINSPIVDGYGLTDLIQKMFAPKTYAVDLQNPEKILFNSEAKTVFQKASGAIQINDGKDAKMKINVSGLANNGVILGSFSLQDSTLDLLFNAIFLTGDSKKQIPINIATKIKGKTNDLLQSTNLDQARQYLGLPLAQKPVEQTKIIAK